MKHYFIHNVLFRLIAPPVYGVIVYLLILLINNDVMKVNELFVNEEVYVCIFLSYLCFESIRLMIVLISKVGKAGNPATQLPLQFLATTALSLIVVLATLSMYFKYFIGFSISNTQLWIFGCIYGISGLLYNLLYFSNYYLQKENTMKLNLERQSRDVLEMEMKEFKNDINPDLLYESLENLIALMYRDVEKAEEYVDTLASAYRYVLANRKHELVDVATELEAAGTMLRLLNEKYHGQLRFESQLEGEELDAMLIPGSLPVIIESLVRNTIITRFEPFVIRCYFEDGFITLQTRLNDKLILHPSSDEALTRLQRSYSLYSDQPLIRVKAYDENYVKLPVIRMADEVAYKQE
jgi:LytS/YehU family sensor histidine kinase